MTPSDMEVSDSHPEACFHRSFSALTVDDVYDIAKLIGADVERLIDGCGKESVAGLVPKIVKVLELLENFTSRNREHELREEELLKTFETLQLRKKKTTTTTTRAGGENDEGEHEIRELQQKEQQWGRRCEELEAQVQQLQEEREELTEERSRLKGSHAQEDRAQRQEREVMLKLKQVVDKQRDELRAKAQEITTVSKEAEALQEQLERFMKMNAELRHKQKVVQAQLKSSVERKADMEADLKEKNLEIETLQSQLEDSGGNNNNNNGPSSLSHAASLESKKKSADDQKDLDRPCFTKKEVRDIIFERNELKTNLFLVQEELNYYQREILNEERCPGFLLEAVRSAIKKRRKLIKAKMLGFGENECSSSDEEEEEERGSTEVDGSEADKPAESRIRNLFGFLTRSGSGQSHAHTGSSASTWEIIGDSEGADETGPGPPPPLTPDP
ncbi:RILP-like protein 1 [Liparis tanakae]|uniref:RILP-like protein 2 n=1 Tax=Liparis tanakae TaxID=230148 RepID=A0A4Z2FBS6_9TELE|nr:RILP-like protein 1 [Liparis tanakae]